jgi:hypothetical protein
MPVTYTNRKGITYHLCRGINKRGKPYYYFAREAKGEPVKGIPEGYKISESVNSFVTLARDRPLQTLPEEIAAVEAAVAQHSKAHNYRVSAKDNRIVVHERVGPSPDELIAELKRLALLVPGQTDRLQEQQDRRARFTPVLRFILVDPKERTFRAERWCYLGSIDDWIDVDVPEPLTELVRDLMIGHRPFLRDILIFRPFNC